MALVENKQKCVDVNKQDGKDKPELMYELQPGDKDLLRPLIYHYSLPGKKLLTKLINVMQYWMDVPEDKVAIITEIGNALHNITLVLDDMEDGSNLRRGVPSAHAIFGIAKVANACFFHGYGIFDTILQLNHPMALRLYLNASLDLLRGQGLELYWRTKSICPTEEEYEQMVIKKAGPITFLMNTYMQFYARESVELNKLLINVALYNQIKNDYESLNSDVLFHDKGFCEDITEGKFSHPIMHAVNSDSKIGKEIIKILKMGTTDLKKLNHCRSLIEGCGSFEYSKVKLQIIKNNIATELIKLGENPFLDQFFTKLFL